MIGKAELESMKATAYIINTARGPIINETDLIAALKSRTIAGAGLDVFDQEPLPTEHPLRNPSQCPNFTSGDELEKLYRPL